MNSSAHRNGGQPQPGRFEQSLRRLYRRLFPKLPEELRRFTADCESLLDVGCGSDSPAQHLPACIWKMGVDAFAPSIEQSRARSIHHEYRLMNVLDLAQAFEPQSFHCVLCCDVIEHLTRFDALRLIRAMEKVASRKVIIKTPNGFLPQDEYDNNPLQVHRSGWEVEEMRALGYDIIGIGGWKPLKGERANLRFRPASFWNRVADVTRPLVRNWPEQAFEILCVKQIAPAQRKSGSMNARPCAVA
jgi:hypothetical protein